MSSLGDPFGCSKFNNYAVINLEAMEGASRDLRAGSFVLWCYFAKNQPGYQFALSNTAALESMGIKRDAYNNAAKESWRRDIWCSAAATITNSTRYRRRRIDRSPRICSLQR